MRRLIVLLAAAGCAVPAAATAAPRGALGRPSDPVSLVDTRNGTLGAGFPQVSAAAPFGMIAPGPDTSLPDGSQNPVVYVGYGYEDPNIRGFSLTHFDGAGIHIAGDLPFMPTTGALADPSSDPAGDSSPYSHSSEVAQPGYYAVTLARTQTRVEITATQRGAIMRCTFPSGTPSGNVLAEAQRAIDGNQSGDVHLVGDHELEGYVKSGVGYKLWFAASFDHPFSGNLALGGGGRGVSFDTSTNRVVTMRVAISYVDQAGAEANLAAELPADRSFEDVQLAARNAWTQRLDDVQVAGGSTAQQKTFYDNLYRSMLLPTVFQDVDGRYLGMDGQVHTVEHGHDHFTSLSLWDVFRSQVPLLELIEPRMARDLASSLVDDAEQNHGVIPRWVQANIDRGIMAGDSGSATLADLAASGLLDEGRTREALSLLLTQAFTVPPVWPRANLDLEEKYGYIPYNVDDIAPSTTQEFGIDDAAVGALAGALGDSADAKALNLRSDDWKNLVNPSGHWVQPRNEDGSWASPTRVGDPTGTLPVSTGQSLPYSPLFQDGYQEETGWQALWAEPQDPAGLASAIGGQKVALRRLDTFFSEAINSPIVPAVTVAQQYASLFGVYYIGNQYTPANEPDLWAPWFYDWYGQPWKAQKVARAEMAAYNSTPTGLPGNDDAGEMSGWYVLAALGIYKAQPGVNAWALSSPAFPSMIMREGRRELAFRAAGASNEKPYVKALSLNGTPVKRTYLTTCELLDGGTLDYTLGIAADKTWGTGEGAAPPSLAAPSPAVDACTATLAG